MIKSSANKITSFLYSNNYLDNDKYEYEVYLYGFEVFIASLLNMLVTLIIGLLFNKLMQTIIFLVCYCPLRQYCGGYHADSYRKCLLIFVSIFLSTIFIAINLDNINLMPIILLISVLNGLNICLLSPIDHINNSISEAERNIYRVKTRNIVIGILLFIFIISQYLIMYEYLIYSALALFWINIMMNIILIKNRRI